MEWIGLILQIILLGAFLFWEGYNKKKGENQALKEDSRDINYEGEKGKNLATKEDIAHITQQYRNIINKPNFYQSCEDFFSYQVFTKAKAWEHEQEVRLFIYKPISTFMALLPFQHDKKFFNHKEIRSFVKIGPECFDSLYIGVRVDATNKEKIIHLAKILNPNIKIYQMETDPNAFRLIAKQEIIHE